MRKEVELQVQSVVDREAALRAEEQRLENMKRVVEVGMRKVEAGLAKGSIFAVFSHFRPSCSHALQVGRKIILSKTSKITTSTHRAQRPRSHHHNLDVANKNPSPHPV